MLRRRSMFLWRYPWVLPLAVLLALGAGGVVGARVAGPRVTDTITETIAAPVGTERLPLADGSKVPRPRDPQEPERTVRIGQAVADGGVTFRVRAFRPRARAPRRAASRFYEAIVEWRNNTGAPLVLFCGSETALVIDEQDNGYDTEDEDDLRPESAKDESCDAQNPGSGDTFTLVYELPRDRRPVALALWNSNDESDRLGESFVLVRLPRRL